MRWPSNLTPSKNTTYRKGLADSTFSYKDLWKSAAIPAQVPLANLTDRDCAKGSGPLAVSSRRPTAEAVQRLSPGSFPYQVEAVE